MCRSLPDVLRFQPEPHRQGSPTDSRLDEATVTATTHQPRLEQHEKLPVAVGKWPDSPALSYREGGDQWAPSRAPEIGVACWALLEPLSAVEWRLSRVCGNSWPQSTECRWETRVRPLYWGRRHVVYPVVSGWLS